VEYGLQLALTIRVHGETVDQCGDVGIGVIVVVAMTASSESDSLHRSVRGLGGRPPARGISPRGRAKSLLGATGGGSAGIEGLAGRSPGEALDARAPVRRSPVGERLNATPAER
jgi:hypothetical protein